MTYRKRIYASAGYNTIYYGSGRKEFNPKNMPPFEEYLTETAQGTCSQVENPEFDEGIIGSFMSGRFINQANLPGFLPYMVPLLRGKPCTAVEGACGTGGRAIATAVKTILADVADAVFVAGFEMQNTMKAVYGADVLAGASYYKKERKTGHSHFFPGVFAERAGAYYRKFGEEKTRQAMAKWYEMSILNARKNPKAQEFHNSSQDLYSLGMTPPNPVKFLPYINQYDCSKVSDGASSIVILSEDGLKKCGVKKENVVEIIGMGASEGDITQPPEEMTIFSNMKNAANKALISAGITLDEIAVLELHDCFTISGLLSLEAIGLAEYGKGPEYFLEGNLKNTNMSGGLSGFGHPTGATGIRQMVDLLHQFTGKADNPAQLNTPYGMMVNMGGNDITLTSIIVKKTED